MSDGMTPLERAASALYDRWLESPDVAREAAMNGSHPAWERVSADTKDKRLDDARAVLQAIREPSEAMIKAMGAKVAAVGHDDGTWSDSYEAWQGAIDAALEEG